MVPTENARIEVTFAIDSVGQLAITAEEEVTGTQIKLKCDKITNLQQSVLDDLRSKVSKTNLKDLWSQPSVIKISLTQKFQTIPFQL